jgi:hypothetical protein
MNQFDEPIQVFGSDLFSLVYELEFLKDTYGLILLVEIVDVSVEDLNE